MSKLFALLSSLTLALAGTGCKKSDTHEQAAAKQVEEARDKVKDEAKGVADKQVDLDTARTQLARARSDYTIELKARLAKIDARLTELRVRADAKAQVAADDLRTKRDQVAAKVDAASTQAESGWDEFKADMAASFDSLEHDLANALN